LMPGMPESFNVLVKEIRSLGMDIDLNNIDSFRASQKRYIEVMQQFILHANYSLFTYNFIAP
jgi:hypothetical protein